MKEIKLTCDKVALVDDEDFDYLNQWKWCAVKKEAGYYAQRKVQKKGIQQTFYLHREILKASKGMYVDHKDHDTLNNRKENLRICTSSQNNANKRARKNCTSKYLGVSWYKRRNRWIVQLQKNGEKMPTKLFKIETEAALYYNECAIKYHGEFANLNKVA